MMLLRLQQGRMAEAEDGVRALAAAYPDIVAIRSGLVVCLLQGGRRKEARAEFERVIEGLEGGLPRDNNYLLTLALLGEAAADLGDAARARRLYESLAPYAGRWVTASSNTALWPVDRSLGVLAGVAGDLAGALAHLAAARRHCEAVDALPSLARLALDEARVLVAGGQPGDAARAAARGRLLAESLGMLGVCGEAAALQGWAEGREPAAGGVSARERE
jgi:predicted Zn-dependent protease